MYKLSPSPGLFSFISEKVMSIISDKWLHNIAAEVLRLPPLNPVVAGMLISVVELHIKKIIQEAHKFQRHGKSKLLSGKLMYTVDEAIGAVQ